MLSTTVNCVPSSSKYFTATNTKLFCAYVSTNFVGVYIGTPDECRARAHVLGLL
jgi:hypothetical protein